MPNEFLGNNYTRPSTPDFLSRGVTMIHRVVGFEHGAHIVQSTPSVMYGIDVRFFDDSAVVDLRSRVGNKLSTDLFQAITFVEPIPGFIMRAHPWTMDSAVNSYLIQKISDEDQFFHPDGENKTMNDILYCRVYDLIRRGILYGSFDVKRDYDEQMDWQTGMMKSKRVASARAWVSSGQLTVPDPFSFDFPRYSETDRWLNDVEAAYPHLFAPWKVQDLPLVDIRFRGYGVSTPWYCHVKSIPIPHVPGPKLPPQGYAITKRRRVIRLD